MRVHDWVRRCSIFGGFASGSSVVGVVSSVVLGISFLVFSLRSHFVTAIIPLRLCIVLTRHQQTFVWRFVNTLNINSIFNITYVNRRALCRRRRRHGRCSFKNSNTEMCSHPDARKKRQRWAICDK